MMRRLRVGVLGACCLFLAGCSGDPAVCEAGLVRACPCGASVEGSQRCANDGDLWQACECPDEPDVGVTRDAGSLTDAGETIGDAALSPDAANVIDDGGAPLPDTGPTVLGETYHVALGGDDGHAGSDQAPWATLEHAAHRVMAGDVVLIHEGRYAGFLVDGDPARDGRPDARVLWRAAGDGDVIIDRPGPNNYRRGGGQNQVDITGTDYWTFDGLIFEGATRAGIAILGFPDAPSQGVHVRNCIARDNATWGIFTGFADDLLLEHNEVHGSTEQHGIYVSNTSHRPVVRANDIHDNIAAGLHLNGDLSAGGEGYVFEPLIEANVIYANGQQGGSAINCDGCLDGVIQNNLLYAGHGSGISLFVGNAAGPSTGNLVVNNTVLQAPDGRWALNIQNNSTHNTVFNNVLWTGHGFRGAIALCGGCREGFVSDYNALRPRLSLDGDATVVGLDEWRAAGLDAHSVAIDVRADLAIDGAFHPLPGSPLVDQGVAEFADRSAPVLDLEGSPRPAASGFDIGAFEAR